MQRASFHHVRNDEEENAMAGAVIIVNDITEQVRSPETSLSD
jgi:hypothetical protein